MPGEMLVIQHERHHTLLLERQAPPVPPGAATHSDGGWAAVPSEMDQSMTGRLGVNEEVRRACSHHCSYPVHEQKWWKVLHCQKRYRHSSSSTLLSGDR